MLLSFDGVGQLKKVWVNPALVRYVRGTSAAPDQSLIVFAKDNYVTVMGEVDAVAGRVQAGMQSG